MLDGYARDAGLISTSRIGTQMPKKSMAVAFATLARSRKYRRFCVVLKRRIMYQNLKESHFRTCDIASPGRGQCASCKTRGGCRQAGEQIISRLGDEFIFSVAGARCACKARNRAIEPGFRQVQTHHCQSLHKRNRHLLHQQDSSWEQQLFGSRCHSPRRICFCSSPS